MPIIIWNGNVVEDAAAFQKMFENEMPYTHFDVQSLDCHVLNATAIPVPADKAKHAEKAMSLTVMVSGYVRLEEPQKGPMKGFSETFVLVPNPDNLSGKPLKTGKRAWLIQSQIFRYVV